MSQETCQAPLDHVWILYFLWILYLACGPRTCSSVLPRMLCSGGNTLHLQHLRTAGAVGLLILTSPTSPDLSEVICQL